MARIVFAWEFGGGLGHILYDLPLAKKLQERGHEVYCVMKNIIDAERILGQHGIKVLQAPSWQVKVDKLENTFNYADTMLNQGYLLEGALKSMVKAWRNLFEKIKPALLVVDHAPTAIIAARGMELKVALYGTGFFAPPRQNPMPSIIPWIKEPDGWLRQSENRILAVINPVLEEYGALELESLCDLFAVEENFLCTFPELDHYQVREQEKYWGPVINLPEGDTPVWPESRDSKKIFCYVKSYYPNLEELLASLKQVKASIIIYAKNAPRELKNKFQSQAMRFAEGPLNMNEVCSSCDLVICHAGHGTIAVTLLHGKPLVLLPEHNQLEQVLIARNIVMQKFGGLVFTRQKKRDYRGAIERVLFEPQFTAEAQKFARKYRYFDPVKQLEGIADRCEEVVQSING